MTWWTERRIALPLTGWPLALLVAGFVLPGLFGHDPWKTEDAVGMGVVWQMVASGNWLTLGLAGEPFYEDGPLYYWVSGLLVKGLAWGLAPHDAARIASGAFVLLALWFVRLAARDLYGKVQGDLSMLALMGCVGLMWHAHQIAPENAMLAGLAAAYYGLAISHKKPLKAAIVFGCGTGAAFLAKGLMAALQPLAAALLVLPLSGVFRARNYAISVALGLVVLVPFVAVWPLAVAHYAPAYFDRWLAWQFASVTTAPGWDTTVYYLKIFVWAAWPVWPLGLWAAWEYRRYLRDPGFAVPFIGAIVAVALLLFGAHPSEMDALAVLVPLAIPAGATAVGLRRGAANALAWFAIMTFTLAAGFAWVMWLVALTGFPSQIEYNIVKLAPGYVFQFRWLPYLVASALTIGWFVLLLKSERSTMRSLTYWAAGATLGVGLVMTLWLDWIDFGKSYRQVATSLARQLPKGHGCIESRGLGESQRATFHYHAGIETRRAELYGATGCRWLLVQALIDAEPPRPGPTWVLVWEGHRPRDLERYRLYRRR
ncbi:MAG: glycosyltransferase family 39 protein [Burkholderiales bacterium]|nr:glycosyltransferase family 39 protein [Burkholderiales bacterium]